MPLMKTAWNATTAAAGDTMTGNATTVITAAKVPTVTVMRSITADIAALARKTPNCVTTAATVWTNAASATKNAADAIRQVVTCVTYATKNVRSASISSATTAASVPSVRAMSCTAPTVCCVSAVRTGLATAAKAAQIVPAAAVNVMRSVWSVQKTSFAPTAEPALSASAARATTAPIVCCVNSVRNTYVNAAGDAPNAS